ncbi:TlyA family RNA methyltransferase [Polyangium spumosum]|uniref:TlyA family rRNA (Cytidine-2'-O)-methyltransferase n=1 Tax=Polyangium spumosum TaxID=889282 RepID=A0A6N7Q163_9BACT|nr:TlyA family RNA methyltransferase [Polyangium spumosum]MRG94711.1 TlyA family rRNA (cytidine-2'-O)-methyltransferase [Polyangium spumosum]
MTRSPARVRADALLVTRGLAESRAQAQALIMAGKVSTEGSRVDKPGALLVPDALLQVAAPPRFVSRGGDKLDHALATFVAQGLDVTGRRCVDVGASTGGFTDCLLQRGAALVVAVDVGYGQLAEKLRQDPRVDVRERVNARELSRSDLPEGVDLVVVDASFIGIGKLIGAIAAMLDAGGDLVALVKPQFEAGREAASRGRGVIRDKETREGAIAAARRDIEAAGFEVVAEVDSAVHGPKGNVERFVWARRRAG